MPNSLGTLEDLAQHLDAALVNAAETEHSALLAAVEVGRLVARVKGQLRHKRWATWLKERCGITPQTAERYLLLAQKWGDLGSTTKGVSREAM